ncbi:MAG: class I SAM-dependent methyltransferase [Planctomycetota bacterium]
MPATELSSQQQVQEDEYGLPVHFRDAIDGSGLNPVVIEYQARLRLVTRLILEANPRRVLDAGCGDGRFCYELKDLGIELVGVDYSAAALRFAKAFAPSVSFYRQDLASLEVVGRFDAILCMETIEHLKPEMLRRVVDGLARVAEPGARLVVTVPSEELALAAKHYQHFTPASLERVLSPDFSIDRMLGLHPLGGLGRLRLRAWTAAAYALFPFRDGSRFCRHVLRNTKRVADQTQVREDPRGCGHLVAVCVRR